MRASFSRDPQTNIDLQQDALIQQKLTSHQFSEWGKKSAPNVVELAGFQDCFRTTSPPSTHYI